MDNERLEEVTLINASSYLHLKENDSGFQYALFDKESRDKVCDGQIDWTELEDSLIANPLAAARVYAIEDIGIEVEKMCRVSVNTLESFRESGVRRRKMFEPETLPKNDIRFINSHYDELFRIPDGGAIQIQYPEETVIKNCFYHDDYHTQVGQSMYHICEFAEIMERRGAIYSPEPISMEEQVAWKVGRDNYLIMQTCDDGWDYTVYDKDFKEVDGGQLDMPELSMQEARSAILSDFKLDKKDLVVADYDEVVERAEAVEKETIRNHEAKSLAEDLELFAAQFDPYEYKDNYNDSKEALDEIEGSLLVGKTDGLKAFFQQVIDEEDEYAALACECLFRVEDYEKKYFPRENVQKEEKHSVLQELNSLKSDTGERAKQPMKSREEVR